MSKHWARRKGIGGKGRTPPKRFRLARRLIPRSSKSQLSHPASRKAGSRVPDPGTRSGTKNRAGGIRTHGLHVPNVALYQAEPQPVEKKRRLGARCHEVNRDFRFGSIKIEALHKNPVSLQTGCSVDVAFLNHQSPLTQLPPVRVVNLASETNKNDALG